jgi:hypothetical protein
LQGLARKSSEVPGVATGAAPALAIDPALASIRDTAELAALVERIKKDLGVTATALRIVTRALAGFRTIRTSHCRPQGGSDRMKHTTVASLVCLLAFVAPADAHHSFVGFYDQERIVEIEGRVASVSWRNPHGSMTIDVTSKAGETAQWRIETGSVSVLRVRGFDRDVVTVGDRVRVAGEPSLKRANGLYARNVLLPSGEEVLLSIGIDPRWSGTETAELLEAQFDEDVAAAARASADGLFRVWSTVFEDPNSFPMFKGNYPVKEAAKAVKLLPLPTRARKAL